MQDWAERHRPLLARAMAALNERGYWSPYPETPSPRSYGEGAKEAQEAAFAALLGRPLALPGHPESGRLVGEESSPLTGQALGISYPTVGIDALVTASDAARGAWAAAAPETRAIVLAEAIGRLNAQSFLVAQAVMHTAGQGFMMAFQAGGPHAQDRALEAVAAVLAEQQRVPAPVRWEKPQGKGEPIRLDKVWRIVPRGIGLVIGCATFPTWNTYPGLFASLAAGNSVIVKPHPAAILPAALSLGILRDVLAEAGFDRNLALLAADTTAAPLTKELALRDEVAIIDFTGGSSFARWLQANVAHKQLYIEAAGINAIAITGAPAFRAMCDNIAFSLALYSGQMCTAPQNLFVPREGIPTDEGHRTFAEVGAGIAAAVDRLLADPQRALMVLGGVQNPATLERIAAARALGTVVRDSASVPGADGARTATPLLVAVEAEQTAAYEEERFGPIAFLIACASPEDAIDRAAASIRRHGAITAALYATEEGLITRAEAAFAAAGANLSINLAGNIFVNQSAAFSDFHATGANPAANAALTDTAFVTGRYRVVAVRRLVPQGAAA